MLTRLSLRSVLISIFDALGRLDYENKNNITKTNLFKYTENFTTQKKWKFSDRKFVVVAVFFFFVFVFVFFFVFFFCFLFVCFFCLFFFFFFFFFIFYAQSIGCGTH